MLTEEQLKAMQTNRLKEHTVRFKIDKEDLDKNLTLKLGLEAVPNVIRGKLGVLVDQFPGEYDPPIYKFMLSDDYGYTIEVHVKKEDK